MKEDGDNLLAYLAARQRGTRNNKISFKIFKKVLLGRQFKQVIGVEMRIYIWTSKGNSNIPILPI